MNKKKERSKLEVAYDNAETVRRTICGVYERICKQAQADHKAACAQANAALTQARADRETAYARANAIHEAAIAPMRDAYDKVHSEYEQAYVRAFPQITTDWAERVRVAEKACQQGGVK